jgi:hypothetical protein
MNNSPGKKCEKGHFCTGGAAIARPLIDGPVSGGGEGGRLCTPGFYCLEGTTSEVPCPAGTYEPRDGSYECQVCPQGYYCPVQTVQPIICPPQHYCPIGTRDGTDYQCPDGYFNLFTGLEKPDQCRPCPPGYAFI